MSKDKSTGLIRLIYVLCWLSFVLMAWDHSEVFGELGWLWGGLVGFFAAWAFRSHKTRKYVMLALLIIGAFMTGIIMIEQTSDYIDKGMCLGFWILCVGERSINMREQLSNVRKYLMRVLLLIGAVMTGVLVVEYGVLGDAAADIADILVTWVFLYGTCIYAPIHFGAASSKILPDEDI
jgi:uncharacterized membrane protein (Fun14 family)